MALLCLRAFRGPTASRYRFRKRWPSVEFPSSSSSQARIPRCCARKASSVTSVNAWSLAAKAAAQSPIANASSSRTRSAVPR